MCVCVCVCVFVEKTYGCVRVCVCVCGCVCACVGVWPMRVRMFWTSKQTKIKKEMKSSNNCSAILKNKTVSVPTDFSPSNSGDVSKSKANTSSPVRILACRPSRSNSKTPSFIPSPVSKLDGKKKKNENNLRNENDESKHSKHNKRSQEDFFFFLKKKKHKGDN